MRATTTHKTVTAVIHEHLRELALSFPKVMPSAPKCTTPPNPRCPVSQGVCSLSSRHRRFMPHIPACSHAVWEARLRPGQRICAPPSHLPPPDTRPSNCQSGSFPANQVCWFKRGQQSCFQMQTVGRMSGNHNRANETAAQVPA